MSARMSSNTFMFAELARKAFERGRRKLRAKPSFTETTSPSAPRRSTRSSRMTFMAGSLAGRVRKQGGEAGARDRLAQPPLPLGRHGGGCTMENDVYPLPPHL